MKTTTASPSPSASVLTSHEVAAKLHTPVAWVRLLTKHGLLVPVRKGRLSQPLYSADDIDECRLNPCWLNEASETLTLVGALRPIRQRH